MLRSVRPSLFHRRAAWLLMLGVLAVALHAFAGTGLMRSGAAGGTEFAAEVCTSHGMQPAAPAGDPQSASHDCCKLCAAGAPALAAAVGTGVAPAPTLEVRRDAQESAPPTSLARNAHPPRGPPARA